MRVARIVIAAVALLVLPTCSAVLNFNECNKDDDCVRFATSMSVAYCTGDHICVSDFPSDRICVLSEVSSNKPDAVTVAGLFRRSGPNDVIDTDIEHAVVQAVDEINMQGERPLRLVLCDTGGDPDQAKKALITAAEKFGAVAGVGPTSSSEVVALAEAPDVLVGKYNFLVVSCSSTAPRVTTLSDQNLVWRTAASDNLQSQVLATLVPSGTTVAASAYINSTYGGGLNDAFSTAVGARFTTPPLIPIGKAFEEGTAGSTVVSFLAAQNPQVALIVADSDAPTWIGALNTGSAPLATTKYLLTDGSKALSLFANGPSTSVVTRMLGTAPATPSGPAFNAFQGTYKGRWSKDPSNTAFVANAYDAMYAIAIAMGAVPAGAKVTGRALIPGMQALSDPTAPLYRVGPSADFGMAFERLGGGGTVNLDGTSGPIDFDPNTGDIVSAPIEIWGVKSDLAVGGICSPTTCDFVTQKVCKFEAPNNNPCPP